jgi:hypothetical protein
MPSNAPLAAICAAALVLLAPAALAENAGGKRSSMLGAAFGLGFQPSTASGPPPPGRPARAHTPRPLDCRIVNVRVADPKMGGRTRIERRRLCR